MFKRSFRRLSPRAGFRKSPDFLIRFIIFALCCVFVVMALLTFFNNFSPIVKQLSIARVEYIGSKILYESVEEILVSGKYEYSDLMSFVKDDNQRINALQTNIIKINQLRAQISLLALNKLRQVPSSEISIPLGNVLSGELLSGRGPKIPIKLIPYGSIHAEVTNLFTEAGINQTRHQIMMTVTANVNVVLPTQREYTQVKTQVSIAETIIVGDVPNSFTHVTGDPNSTIGKINDYKDK